MVEAGLIVDGPDIRVPYDRFRDRVIFPIKDARGRVIAFGGRAMSADVPAKYLNSPDTDLFHKSYVLYNYNTARSAAYDAGTIIAVEGYTDVIALTKAGYPNTVAPLGTALTPDQLKLMWKVVAEPILCFDGDDAGLKAAFRAIDTALPLLEPGHSLKFALLPAGTDPDDLISDGGREAMEDVLADARPLSAMLWEREYAVSDLSTPERRADFDARLHAAVREISDERVKAHYTDFIREKLRGFSGAGGRRAPENRFGGQQNLTSLQTRRGQPGKRAPLRPWDLQMPASSALKKVAGVSMSRNASARREQLIIWCLINHPFLIEKEIDSVAELEFLSSDLDRLRKEILDTAALHDGLETSLLNNHLVERGFSKTLGQLEAKMTQASDWFVLPDAARADVETGWAQLVNLHNKALTLQKELKAAESAFAEEQSEANLAHLNEVREQIRSQIGEEAMVEGFGEASGRVRSTM
ncbi:MAG: DNA primase, partial [Hyphomicrobiales bacterium]